jgi:hypothetical protein
MHAPSLSKNISFNKIQDGSHFWKCLMYFVTHKKSEYTEN